MLTGNFGFITTLIGTNPDLTLGFGLGGLTGITPAGAVPGPSFVKSITKTANNGEFLVTLQDGYRAVWGLGANLQGVAAGPADGFWCQTCSPVNEGAGHETPITFLLTTLNAAGVPTETTGRKVMVNVILKNSGTGT